MMDCNLIRDGVSISDPSHHHNKEIDNNNECDDVSTPISCNNTTTNTNDLFQNDENSILLASSQSNCMKVTLDLVVRLVLPLFNGVARGWQGIRDVNMLRILNNVRPSRQLLTNLLAFAANTISLSLSTVQVVHKIDPLLKMIKLKKNSKQLENVGELDQQQQQQHHQQQQQQQQRHNLDNNNLAIAMGTFKIPTIKHCTAENPEKCVTLNVLAQPPPGIPIRADVVFIHGLHGSLVNTWKQGLWNSEGRRVNFKRPPKPPIRPPKRPRHSRAILFDPPHDLKRLRLCSQKNDDDDDDDDIDLDDNNQQKNENITTNHTNIKYIDLIDSKINKNMNEYDNFPNNSNDDEVIEFINNINYTTFRLRNDDQMMNDIKSSDSHNSNNNNNNNNNNNSNNNEKCEENISSSSLNIEEEYSKCWPGDWLPIDCPGVRVIAVNYTTDPYLWRPIWIRKRLRTALAERSREMMDLLTEIGVGIGHPIVWVGHSKGGIFIKQIMVDAWESGKVALAPLWRSSRGCLFYSVPHRGSPLADFNLPLLRQSIELMEIKKNCPSILELHRRFVALYRCGNFKIDVFSFVETALTLMSVLYLRIVGIDSADPGIGEVFGVHLDHREICKPRNRNCMLYTKLTDMINKIS